MKNKILATAILLTSIFLMSCSSTPRQTNGIYYIELQGTPYEMGKQHGSTFARLIKKAVADYKDDVAKTFGKKKAPKILDWALHKARFRKDVHEHLPHVWEEMRGIADGAKVPLDDIFLLQMFEEVYEAAPRKVGLKPQEMFGHGCTAFIADSGGKQFIGQNMDYSGNLRKQQLMVRYKYPDKEILNYTFVGQIGGIGVNSKGLSVFATTLPQGKKRHMNGLGSSLILRALLQEDSVEAALKRLGELPRFGSLSYSMGDFFEAVIVETSSEEIVRRKTSDQTAFLIQTNHLQRIKKRRDIPGFYENGKPIRGMPFKTLERMESGERFLGANRYNLTSDKIKHMLTTMPININIPTFMTLQSAFVEYDDKKICFYASAGHDPLRKWNEYGF